MMFPRRRKGWRWIHPTVAILSLLLSLLLSQSSRADVTFEYRYQNLRGLSDESKQQDAKNDNKVVLLNDLSLEQAYLHRTEIGPMPSESSASIVQQAARLAAGAYAGDTGNAQGWKVQSKYNFLNSVAVISVRPEGHGCALAFRGSDDRLDWRNDYRARPLSLMLCQQAPSHGPLSLLDPVERVTGAARQRVDQWRRGDGSNSTSEQSEEEEEKQSDGICGKRLGRYTVHYGFYHSFWLLTEGTNLGKDWSALTSNGTCNPNLSIITGHSLGGAFVIYAKILQWPGIGITLAAPRAVANGSCPLLSSTGPPPSPTTIDHLSSASTPPPSPSSSASSSASSVPSQHQQQQQHPKEQEQYARLPSTPMTRFYLTDDPVPAIFPVSDSLRLEGVGGAWVHCGCAMALEPFIPTNQDRESLGIRQSRADRRNDNEADEGEEQDKEEEAEQKEDPDEAKKEEEKEEEDEEYENRISFRAKMMGCGSNEPWRKREPPSLPPPPPPPPPSFPPLSLAALLGLNNGDRGKEKEGKEEEVGRQEPGIKRHLHTRYVKAIDRACSGLSPDSRRCLLDHVD